jgi:hypothetical protein
MESETAQATSEIPSTPRPEVWPEKWTFQHWYWCQAFSQWRCINAVLEYNTEQDAINSARRHEHKYGGPVRIIRIPGSDASKGGQDGE